MVYVIIGGVVVLLLVLYYFATHNSFVKLQTRVEESFATMDVYLKKRWDLIPNLVETVKGYAKHEQELIEKVVSLRNSTYENMTSAEKVKTNNELTKGLSRLIALGEAYPDLKASQNFVNLSQQLGTVEGEIANARTGYNAAVRDFNTKVKTIPSNIVASMMGLKEKEMFEATEEERQTVQVKF